MSRFFGSGLNDDVDFSVLAPMMSRYFGSGPNLMPVFWSCDDLCKSCLWRQSDGIVQREQRAVADGTLVCSDPAGDNRMNSMLNFQALLVLGYACDING